MNGPLYVLIVEDNNQTLDIVSKVFSKEKNTTVERAETLAIAEVRLAKGGIQVILLDLNLPDASGTESVNRLARVFPGVPIVVYTGEGRGLEAECLQLGAEDFRLKTEVTGPELITVVRHAVIRHSARCAFVRVRETLQEAKDPGGKGDAVLLFKRVRMI